MKYPGLLTEPRQFLIEQDHFSPIMDQHRQAHVGCQNETYTKLSLETGSDNWSPIQAKANVKELFDKRFSDVMTAAETCDTLQAWACLVNTSGRVKRELESRVEISKGGKVERTRALAGRLDFYLEYSEDLEAFSQKILFWLQTICHSTAFICVAERIKIMYYWSQRRR